MRATEAECQQTIVEAARLAGWMVHAERPATMRSGKRKPNKVEPAQRNWLDAIGSLDSWIVAKVVWVPEEMDAFISELTRSGRAIVAHASRFSQTQVPA